jgi:hypothetical protein
MKWTYAIPHKFTTSLLLLTVILIVFFNNLQERRNSSELRIAFDAIYEDRLLAESYILQLSSILHEVDEWVKAPKTQNTVQPTSQLQKIDALNLLYQDTQLTQKEAEYFTHFTALTKQLKNELKTEKFQNTKKTINSALLDLRSLSVIQVTEAEMIMSKTDRMLTISSISSHVEMGIIIAIGLMIQALLFTSKTLQPKNSDVDHRLN